MVFFESEAHFQHLSQFEQRWGDMPDDEMQDLATAIDNAAREEDIQSYLAANPRALVNLVGGGHGRYLIPKQRLGSEFVTDFLIGEAHSFGFSWLAVELEPTTTNPFLKDGTESSRLRGALNQIREWRTWLAKNTDYAARVPPNGLGLSDVGGSARGLVIIGRRHHVDALSQEARQRSHDVRRDLRDRLDITVHTYDWLIDSTKLRVAESQGVNVLHGVPGPWDDNHDTRRGGTRTYLPPHTGPTIDLASLMKAPEESD